MNFLTPSTTESLDMGNLDDMLEEHTQAGAA